MSDPQLTDNSSNVSTGKEGNPTVVTDSSVDSKPLSKSAKKNKKNREKARAKKLNSQSPLESRSNSKPLEEIESPVVDQEPVTEPEVVPPTQQQLQGEVAPLPDQVQDSTPEEIKSTSEVEHSNSQPEAVETSTEPLHEPLPVSLEEESHVEHENVIPIEIHNPQPTLPEVTPVAETPIETTVETLEHDDDVDQSVIQETTPGVKEEEEATSSYNQPATDVDITSRIESSVPSVTQQNDQVNEDIIVTETPASIETPENGLFEKSEDNFWDQISDQQAEAPVESQDYEIPVEQPVQEHQPGIEEKAQDSQDAVEEKTQVHQEPVQENIQDQASVEETDLSAKFPVEEQSEFLDDITKSNEQYDTETPFESVPQHQPDIIEQLFASNASHNEQASTNEDDFSKLIGQSSVDITNESQPQASVDTEQAPVSVEEPLAEEQTVPVEESVPVHQHETHTEVPEPFTLEEQAVPSNESSTKEPSHSTNEISSNQTTDQTLPSDPQPTLFADDGNAESNFWENIGQSTEPSQVDSPKPTTNVTNNLLNKFSSLDLDDDLLLDDELLDDELLEDEPAKSEVPTQNTLQQVQQPQQQQKPQQPQQQQQSYNRYSNNQYTPNIYAAPPQPQPQQHHLDIRKLNEQKQKSDAYDFPAELMASKQVTHRPSKIALSQPQTPALPPKAPYAPPSAKGLPAQLANAGTPLAPPKPAFSSNSAYHPQSVSGPPSVSGSAAPPKTVKKKQSSFFEELPILAPVAPARPARVASTASNSPLLNNVQNAGRPPIGNATTAPPLNPYAPPGQVHPPIGAQKYGQPSQPGQPGQPPVFPPGPPQQQPQQQPPVIPSGPPQHQQQPGFNAYAPPSSLNPPNAANVPAVSPAISNVGQAWNSSPSFGQSHASVGAPSGPTAGTAQGRYAPQNPSVSQPPQANQYGAPVNQGPAGYNVVNPSISHIIQNATPKNDQPSIQFPGNQAAAPQGPQGGLHLSVPMNPSDSLKSPSVSSPNATRYAPINHKRQASATANQYDPYSIVKIQNQQQNHSVLPPIQQQQQYNPQSAVPVPAPAPAPLPTYPPQPAQQIQQVPQPVLQQSPVYNHVQASAPTSFGASTLPPSVPNVGVPAPPQNGPAQIHPQGYQQQQQSFQTFQQPSQQSSLPLERRQFPLFNMSQGKIVYLVPKGYQNDLHIVDTNKVLKDSILKDFPVPSKKNAAAVDKFLDQRIETLAGSLYSETDVDELVLVKLLKHKWNNTEGPFSLDGSVDYDEPLQRSFQQRPKQPLNKRNLIYHIVSGQKEEALNLAQSAGDHTLALLIASSIDQARYSNVVKDYLDQEFGPNSSSLLKSIYSSEVDFTINKDWNLLNWKALATAAVSNHQQPAFYLNSLATFLKANGKTLPAYILFVLGDAKISAFKWPKSLKFSLYNQIYSSINATSNTVDDIYSSQLITAGFLLDQNLVTEAQKYIDLAVNSLRTSKGDVKEIIVAKQYLSQLKQLTDGKDSWFTRPTLDKVWGQLDKKLSKFISGDEEVNQSKTEGVFSSYSPGVSRSTSVVSLTAAAASAAQGSSFGLDKNLSSSRVPGAARHPTPYTPGSVSHEPTHQSGSFARPEFNRTLTAGSVRRTDGLPVHSSPVSGLVNASPKSKTSKYGRENVLSRKSSTHSIFSQPDESYTAAGSKHQLPSAPPPIKPASLGPSAPPAGPSSVPPPIKSTPQAPVSSAPPPVKPTPQGPSPSVPPPVKSASLGISAPPTAPPTAPLPTKSIPSELAASLPPPVKSTPPVSSPSVPPPIKSTPLASVPSGPPQSKPPSTFPERSSLGQPPQFTIPSRPETPPVTHHNTVSHSSTPTAANVANAEPQQGPLNEKLPSPESVQQQQSIDELADDYRASTESVTEESLDSYGVEVKQEPSESTLVPKESSEEGEDLQATYEHYDSQAIDGPTEDIEGKEEQVNIEDKEEIEDKVDVEDEEDVREDYNADETDADFANQTVSDFGDSARPYEIPEELQDQVLESHPSYTSIHASQNQNPYAPQPIAPETSRKPNSSTGRFTPNKYSPVDSKVELSQDADAKPEEPVIDSSPAPFEPATKDSVVTPHNTYAPPPPPASNPSVSKSTPPHNPYAPPSIPVAESADPKVATGRERRESLTGTAPHNPYAPPSVPATNNLSNSGRERNSSLSGSGPYNPYAPPSLPAVDTQVSGRERKESLTTSSPYNAYAPPAADNVSTPNRERKESLTGSGPYNPYAPQNVVSPAESKFNPYQPSGQDSISHYPLPEATKSDRPSKFEPYRPPSISAPTESNGEGPSLRMTKFEPPTTNHNITNIPEEEEYYDDVVEDSDDEEDEEPAKQAKPVEKPKVEAKKPEKKETKESGGWFSGWIGKGDSKKNEKKVYKAKLGEKSKFYFNEELQRWVNEGDNLDELKAESLPPPPPTIKKKPSNLTRPRPDSISEGSGAPPNNGPTPLPNSGLPPVSGGPAPSGPPPGRPGAGAPKKPSAVSDLDSLMSLAGPGTGASTRRKKRAGYVNVMNEFMDKK